MAWRVWIFLCLSTVLAVRPAACQPTTTSDHGHTVSSGPPTISGPVIKIVSPSSLNETQILACTVCLPSGDVAASGNVSFRWSDSFEGNDSHTPGSNSCAGIEAQSMIQVTASTMLRHLWLYCLVSVEEITLSHYMFLLNPDFAFNHVAKDGSLAGKRSLPVNAHTKDVFVPCWTHAGAAENTLSLRGWKLNVGRQRIFSTSIMDPVVVTVANTSGVGLNAANDSAPRQIRVHLLHVRFNNDSYKVARVCPDDSLIQFICKVNWPLEKHRSIRARIVVSLTYDGVLPAVTLCPREMVKITMGRRRTQQFDCYIPNRHGSNGSYIVWRHSGVDLAKTSACWNFSSQGLSGPHGTQRYAATLARGLTADTGNVSCSAADEGGRLIGKSASLRLLVSENYVEQPPYMYILQPLQLTECVDNQLRVSTSMQEVTGHQAVFQVTGYPTEQVNVSLSVRKEPYCDFKSAFYIYHLTVHASGDVTSLLKAKVSFLHLSFGNAGSLDQFFSGINIPRTCITQRAGTSSASAAPAITLTDPTASPGSSSSWYISVGIVGIAFVVAVAVIVLAVHWQRTSASRKHSVLTESVCTTSSASTPTFQLALDSGKQSQCELPTPCYSQPWLEVLAPFLNPDWHIPPTSITNIVHLSSGEFGEVMTGVLTAEPATVGVVALKKAKDQQSSLGCSDLINELDALTRCGQKSHPNIIGFIGVTILDGKGAIVLSYAENGNLLNFLRQRRAMSQTDPLPMFSDVTAPQHSIPPSRTAEQHDSGMHLAPNGHPKVARHLPSTSSCMISAGDALLREYNVCIFASQIASAMQYLASLNCVHRDLAARNVLIDSSYTLKVADFGLARHLKESDYYEIQFGERTIPAKWHPPESLLDRLFWLKSDVWSYGVLLWEITTLGTTPFRGISALSLGVHLKAGHRLEQPDGYSKEMYQIMCDCWKLEPDKRPSFDHLLETVKKLVKFHGSQDEASLDYQELFS